MALEAKLANTYNNTPETGRKLKTALANAHLSIGTCVFCISLYSTPNSNCIKSLHFLVQKSQSWLTNDHWW